MPIPTYTPGYPPDGSSLGQTKSTIRNNLDGTFETLAIDHVNNNGSPGSQPAGYHTIIHQVPQTSVATVTGYNQVFSGVPGTLVVNGVTTPTIPADSNTQLYSLNSAGSLYQLTGDSPNPSGFAWMGGILMIWGTTAISGTGVPIAFSASNAVFPNNLFNIIVSAVSKSGGAANVGTVSVVSGSTSKTGFTYQYKGTAGDYVSISWLAIGN